jgi:imidazole glycerol-phosphate synthase subunit HisH
MMKVSILDYKAGNINSIKNALEFIGLKTDVITKPNEIIKSDALVVPGVGSFGFAMKQLEKSKNNIAIIEYIKKGKPLLGICLGMQILFQISQESVNIKGLGIFKGEVVKFKKGKVPQIGWNKILFSDNNTFNNGFAYYVNSYYVIPKNKNLVLAKSKYYIEFTSAIKYENITAFQFHPEKSGEYGLELLRRWSKSFQKE